MEPTHDDRTVADVFAHNATSIKQDLTEAELRLDSLFSQRTKMVELGTVGGLTLNGASILAVFTALQVSGQGASYIGLDNKTAAIALCLYLIGSIQAVISIYAETNHLNAVCGKQYARTSVLRRSARYLASPANKANVDGFGETLVEIEQKPPLDFSYSKLAMWTRAGSGSFWLGGTMAMLAKVFVAAM